MQRCSNLRVSPRGDEARSTPTVCRRGTLPDECAARGDFRVGEGFLQARGKGHCEGAPHAAGRISQDPRSAGASGDGGGLLPTGAVSARFGWRLREMLEMLGAAARRGLRRATMLIQDGRGRGSNVQDEVQQLPGKAEPYRRRRVRASASASSGSRNPVACIRYVVNSVVVA